tara:strand:+ start:229 stop:435 length:207 start_codon:yes stop_codon:yes gene_type:complete
VTIKVGDLVRIAARCFEPCEPSTLVGLVVGFGKTKTVGILEPGKAAKIEWTSGVLTVESLRTLERVEQ